MEHCVNKLKMRAKKKLFATLRRDFRKPSSCRATRAGDRDVVDQPSKLQVLLPHLLKISVDCTFQFFESLPENIFLLCSGMEVLFNRYSFTHFTISRKILF